MRELVADLLTAIGVLGLAIEIGHYADVWASGVFLCLVAIYLGWQLS